MNRYWTCSIQYPLLVFKKNIKLLRYVFNSPNSSDSSAGCWSCGSLWDLQKGLQSTCRGRLAHLGTSVRALMASWCPLSIGHCMSLQYIAFAAFALNRFNCNLSIAICRWLIWLHLALLIAIVDGPREPMVSWDRVLVSYGHAHSSTAFCANILHSFCVCIRIYIYYYESQPKAWAEYRYKRSEAKLIWGVWGGEALIRARLGRCWGELQKWAAAPRFLKLEREAPVWTLLVVFWRFSLGVKSQNTVIYSVFGLLAWKKYFVQHAENCVNTTVFARCRPQNTVNTVVFATRSKKHRKYRGFGLARRKKRYLRRFLLRDASKNTKTPPNWQFLGFKNERFFALEMPVKKHAATTTTMMTMCKSVCVRKRVCV